ncbi:MAG TPA: protoglobin domain-containing protein [Noviherbaspirillum sp.]|nr:protoglobin domain-containing protein [Noviherbaspirillum sp.]
MDAKAIPRKDRNSLLQGMEIDEQEIRQRKKFLQFDETDEARLVGINELAQQYADVVIEDFYKHIMAFDETRAFFTDPKVLERVKNAQKQYFLRLTRGNYDAQYVEERLRIGAAHERISLPIKSYLGMYNFYLRTVAGRVFHAYKNDPGKALDIFLSLTKLTFFDMGLAIDTYVSARERTIGDQQDAIRELSTPVLPFRPGILILPIVGLIDSYRASQLTEQLLRAIRDNRAKYVVVDITGVPYVDSRVASHLVQTVEAARLMGAKAIVSGVSPEIALTMVAIGADLGRVETVGDMQSGIERAEQLSGYRMVKIDKEKQLEESK